MNDNKVSPDQALHDLTLVMLYLTRFKDRKKLFFKGNRPFGPGNPMIGIRWINFVKKS